MIIILLSSHSMFVFLCLFGHFNSYFWWQFGLNMTFCLQFPKVSIHFCRWHWYFEFAVWERNQLKICKPKLQAYVLFSAFGPFFFTQIHQFTFVSQETFAWNLQAIWHMEFYKIKNTFLSTMTVYQWESWVSWESCFILAIHHINPEVNCSKVRADIPCNRKRENWLVSLTE